MPTTSPTGTVLSAAPETGQSPVLAALDQGAEEFLPRLECHFEGLVAAEPDDLDPLDRKPPHVVGGVVERAVRQVLHLSGDPVPVRHHHDIGLLSLKGCHGTHEGEGEGAAMPRRFRALAIREVPI